MPSKAAKEFFDNYHKTKNDKRSLSAEEEYALFDEAILPLIEVHQHYLQCDLCLVFVKNHQKIADERHADNVSNFKVE